MCLVKSRSQEPTPEAGGICLNPVSVWNRTPFLRAAVFYPSIRLLEGKILTDKQSCKKIKEVHFRKQRKFKLVQSFWGTSPAGLDTWWTAQSIYLGLHAFIKKICRLADELWCPGLVKTRDWKERRQVFAWWSCAYFVPQSHQIIFKIKHSRHEWRNEQVVSQEYCLCFDNNCSVRFQRSEWHLRLLKMWSLLLVCCQTERRKHTPCLLLPFHNLFGRIPS